jgi:hypothetical protein
MAQGLTTPATSKISKLTTYKDQNMQEFLLYFSPKAGAKSLLEALHALYYLPQNYKLVLTDRTAATSDKVVNWAMQNFMNRIRFEDETETIKQEETSPFSSIDAILADSTTDPAYAHVTTPLLVVSDSAEYDLAYNERHGFSVPAGNPEALASAVLRLARARA